jgi:glucose-1-phosphate adenylyltransferase
MSSIQPLVMILAGGEGKRLYPLTRDRAKPAVPFGGRYRIIDFVINNFINSGFYKIKILTQYKSDSLNLHVARSWPLSPIMDQYIDLVPAQMRTDGNWYKGTADAIYQNLTHIHDELPENVCVFGGDHIYKMNVQLMYIFHKKQKAALTISAMPIPIEEAGEFGIMEVDENWRLINFIEKPKERPRHIPGNPDMCLASMGNYIFKSDVLVNEVTKDAKNPSSLHDFGKNLIPTMLRNGACICVYDFTRNTIEGMSEQERYYWKDVGTIDAYWQANMDLLDYEPQLNLYSKEWQIRTYNYNLPPAKFIWAQEDRVGMATDSIISEGCIISGGSISRCVLSPNVRINSFCNVAESILMENVVVGRHANIRRAIVDKNVFIPPNTQIGFDRNADEARGFTVTAEGITVVPKGAEL